MIPPVMCLVLRSKRQTLEIISRINSSPTEKNKMKLRVQYGVVASRNPLLELPLDLHR